jgi:tRNA nucleotidyltransferase/poly(A) polymerase
MHTLLDLFYEYTLKEGIADRVFIVGGAVRDILLGRTLKDIDIALKGDAPAIAEEFARRFDATFVLLDKEFETARVVKDGVVLDISPLRGASIYDDLAERDITINAMALPAGYDSIDESLIDPFKGRRDLFDKIVRMVSENNLLKDPLRVLRVYRFAATLSFSVDHRTLDAARRCAALLRSVAAERITDELRHILKSEHSSRTFHLMEERDGILHQLFPDVIMTAHAFMFYRQTEEVCENLSRYFSGCESFFNVYFADTYKKTCLKLSTLFPDRETAERALLRLRLSNKETELILSLVQHRDRILHLYEAAAPQRTMLIRSLKELRDELYPLLILTAALSETARRENSPAILAFCRELLVLYHGTVIPRLRMLPLITGDDLVREFHLSPSPLFRTILSEIEDRVLEGAVASRKEAFDLVKRLLKEKESAP